MATPRDIVIVGAGPAGITAALALVHYAPNLRQRILVLDKSAFPREKYCAGGIGGRGETLLRSLDAWPAVARVAIEGASLQTRTALVSVRPGQLGSVVRRIEFDAALVAIAKRRGIAIRENVSVRSLDETAGGVALETSAGVVNAQLVFGADGVGSVIRRTLVPTSQGAQAQVLEVDTVRAGGDGPADTIHFDLSDHTFRGYFWDFPTIVDGLPMMCRGVYRLRREPLAASEKRAEHTDSGVDLADLLDARLARLGLSLASCTKKRFSERGYDPAATLASRRILLLGEAAGIDPVTGEGIAQAIEYGVLAARFVASASDQTLLAWTDVLKRSRLGRDLATRTWALRHFYGRPRAACERLLTASALHAAATHFAGRNVTLPSLAPLFASTIAAGIRYKAHQSLSRFF